MNSGLSMQLCRSNAALTPPNAAKSHRTRYSLMVLAKATWLRGKRDCRLIALTSYSFSRCPCSARSTPKFQTGFRLRNTESGRAQPSRLRQFAQRLSLHSYHVDPAKNNEGLQNQRQRTDDDRTIKADIKAFGLPRFRISRRFNVLSQQHREI